MQDWVFANIIVFFASLLQAATGFGFAIMATPFLLLVFNSRECIQLSILLSFIIAISLTPKIWRDIHCGLLRKLISGSILGVPIGLLLFVYLSLDWLKIFVGIVTLIVAVFSLVRWYNTRRASKLPRTEKSEDEIAAEPVGRGQWLVGMCSGILTTSIGMPGVPLALYFSMNNINKEIIRSTTLAFFIVVYALSIAVQVFTVHIANSVIWSSVKLIPAVVAGVICGCLLFPKVSQSVFQLIVNVILLSTAFYLLAKPW